MKVTESKTIFSRFQDIKLGKSKDEWGEEISDVETSMKKIGINIRKDKTHFKEFSQVLVEIKSKWKDLNDLEKSTVTKSLAGTRQRENMLVLLDNMDKVEALKKKVKEADGNAEDKYNKNYANSMEAKINEFKHSWEKLYETVISSDALKKIVESGTKLIQMFDGLISSSKNVKASILILLPSVILLSKRFKAFFTVLKTDKVLDISTAFKTLFNVTDKGVPSITNLKNAIANLKGNFKILGTVLLNLITTPTGLMFLGIATAIGVATVALTKHIKHQKELKEENAKLTQSYADLKTAMKSGNVEKADESLGELKKKQEEYKNLLKEREKLSTFLQNNKSLPTGIQTNTTSKINKLTTRINELGKEFKSLGVEID